MGCLQVGHETINHSDDPILKQDMPASLRRVTEASKTLEKSSDMIKTDPYSKQARRLLIDGARGILQGTSSLLLCFDESEVRKIIRECKKVLDYLAVAEVIESMEDLVQFVKVHAVLRKQFPDLKLPSATDQGSQTFSVKSEIRQF